MSDSIIKRARDRIQGSQYLGPPIFAMLVGLLAGLGAVAFRYLIQGAHWLFFELGGQLTAKVAFIDLGRTHIIFAPAIGLLLVSMIVRRWAMEAKGHGVPEVQYAVRKKGGRIRLRVSAVKALASALCIGSGGAVGREGPIVQIGCSLGSNVGQAAGFKESEINVLVACGAAGGVAATFNAPIAGVLFALEVILGSFAARSFGLVVISSVTAVALSHAFLGKQPAFELVEAFTLHSSWELPLYLGLGLFTGVISLLYVKSVYFSEYWFDQWKLNPYAKAFLGGLAVGLLGYFGSEHVFGVGYEAIELALENGLGLKLLLLLLVLKMLATPLTLGAGGSGGVFAPALFIGAMAGGVFGLAANYLFPGVALSPGAYVLVGMAALFAGAAHAPITSVIILFEMTDDYKIILPLMLAVVVSHLISRSLSRDSIYTVKLRRLGGFLPPRPETGFLDMVLVSDAMALELHPVRPQTTVPELARLLNKHHVRSCPVVDENDKLAGIVTEYDVEKAVLGGEADNLKVADIMTTKLVTCVPDECLRVALNKFSGRDFHRYPVVAPNNPEKLVGVLRRGEIMFAYHEWWRSTSGFSAKNKMEIPIAYRDSVQLNFQVRPDRSDICFRKISDLKLPDQCLIVVLYRGEHMVIPRGDTVIEPGDVLLLHTTRSHEGKVRRWIGEL